MLRNLLWYRSPGAVRLRHPRDGLAKGPCAFARAWWLSYALRGWKVRLSKNRHKRNPTGVTRLDLHEICSMAHFLEVNCSGRPSDCSRFGSMERFKLQGLLASPYTPKIFLAASLLSWIGDSTFGFLREEYRRTWTPRILSFKVFVYLSP